MRKVFLRKVGSLCQLHYTILNKSTTVELDVILEKNLSQFTDLNVCDVSHLIICWQCCICRFCYDRVYPKKKLTMICLRLLIPKLLYVLLGKANYSGIHQLRFIL
jgi:hypothetical protein